MRRLTPREIVLLVVLGVGALAYLWYLRSGSSPLDDKLAKGVEGTYSAADAPVVELARLQGETEAFDPAGRDLFKYSKPPVDPDALARQRALEDARRKAQEDARKRREAEARNRPRVPATPQPPGIPLKYIGYLGPKDDKIAFFLDGDEILQAQSGDVLMEKFRLVEIRYETVVMGFTDQKWLDRTRELTLSSN